MDRYKYEVVASDNPKLAGNWHPFPPPDEGFYNFRKVTEQDGMLAFELYLNRRVYQGVQNRLLCMGVRVARMRPQDGWQFRFLPEVQGGVPIRYRPFAVIYGQQEGQPPQIVRRNDVSQQLPIAASREEALYIVRSMPERWPVFCQIHIEYTEEKQQS